jgi:tRNA pseudouridine13 synthase
MKLKSIPEDFIVEEEIDATPQKQGGWALYCLTKRQINTTEAILEAADALKVPRPALAYAGRKDRHAVTTQHITIQDLKHPPQTFTTAHAQFKLLGFLERPVGPDLIKTNRFVVVARDVKEAQAQAAPRRLEAISRYGFVNYFDDQRFASYVERLGFFGEKILKKHWNGALKIHLTRASSEDKKEMRARKLRLRELWGDWKACLTASATPYEQKTFSHLIRQPQDHLRLLGTISRDDLSAYVSAFQSYLWNEVARRIVLAAGCVTHIQPGLCGDYIFPADPAQNAAIGGETVFIPMPASRLEIDDKRISDIYANVLADHGLKTSQFNMKSFRTIYFKPFPRVLIARPYNATQDQAPDERNPGRLKVTLKFSLSRGVFATMFLKDLWPRLTT